MKYAISNWIYGDEPLEDVFMRLRRYGYDGIELLGEPEKYDVAEVRRLCTQYGISVCSVLSWCLSNILDRDPAHPDPAVRFKTSTYLKGCVDFAREVGAPIVIILPAPSGRTSPVGAAFNDAVWDQAVCREWETAVHSTRELAKYARSQSITLAIEPLNRFESFMVTNLEKAERFIADVAVENLKVHLDTFHMSIEERDLAEVVKQAGASLVNMHLSDSNREAPGRGHTDFSGIMKSLAEISYDGYLVMEPIPPGSNAIFDATRPASFPYRDIYAKEGIEYLRKLEGLARK